jgi:dihydrofolate reductase
MSITIYSAISLDGFLATKDGGTDWVLDWDLYEKTCKDFGCVVMGKNTYDEGGSIFEGAQHIILTSSSESPEEESITFAKTCEEVIKIAESKGFDKLLVIGGAKTNQSFLECAQVSQLIVDVHPLLLEDGLPAFGRLNRSFEFEQVSSKAYPEGFTQIIYKVK